MKTKIEWTATHLADGTIIPGFTWNPWWGCTKVSPGCTHCYADTLATRYGWDVWGPGKDRRFFAEQHWAEPLKWNKAAAAAGYRARVFCASMADVFEANDQLTTERTRLWPLIAATPHLEWLLLTKRPENIALMTPVAWQEQLPVNVEFGFSAENQEWFDERWPHMRPFAERGAIIFVSAEPLVGGIRLPNDFLAFGRQM